MKNKLSKIVTQMKSAQAKLQTLIDRQSWVDEARKYAERQGKEVKKLLSSDLGKVKIFIDRQSKELERFQKRIPGEVKKLRGFVQVQRKELEKLLFTVRKASAKKPPAKAKRATPRKTATKAKT